MEPTLRVANWKSSPSKKAVFFSIDAGGREDWVTFGYLGTVAKMRQSVKNVRFFHDAGARGDCGIVANFKLRGNPCVKKCFRFFCS